VAGAVLGCNAAGATADSPDASAYSCQIQSLELGDNGNTTWNASGDASCTAASRQQPFDTALAATGSWSCGDGGPTWTGALALTPDPSTGFSPTTTNVAISPGDGPAAPPKGYNVGAIRLGSGQGGQVSAEFTQGFVWGETGTFCKSRETGTGTARVNGGAFAAVPSSGTGTIDDQANPGLGSDPTSVPQPPATGTDADTLDVQQPQVDYLEADSSVPPATKAAIASGAITPTAAANIPGILSCQSGMHANASRHGNGFDFNYGGSTKCNTKAVLSNQAILTNANGGPIDRGDFEYVFAYNVGSSGSYYEQRRYTHYVGYSVTITPGYTGQKLYQAPNCKGYGASGIQCALVIGPGY